MLARIISLLIVLFGFCGWLSPAAAVEASQSFVAPVIKDFRLDWGRNWGAACGGARQRNQPILPGGPFSAPLLTSKQRFDEDLENWYSDVLFKKDPTITVEVTGALHCLGGDPASQFCERKTKNLHTRHRIK